MAGFALVRADGHPTLGVRWWGWIGDHPAGQPGTPSSRPIHGYRVTRGNNGTVPPLTLPATPGPVRPLTDTTPDDLVRRTVFVDTIVLPQRWQPA